MAQRNVVLLATTRFIDGLLKDPQTALAKPIPINFKISHFSPDSELNSRITDPRIEAGSNDDELRFYQSRGLRQQIEKLFPAQRNLSRPIC